MSDTEETPPYCLYEFDSGTNGANLIKCEPAETGMTIEYIGTDPMECKILVKDPSEIIGDGDMIWSSRSMEDLNSASVNVSMAKVAEDGKITVGPVLREVANLTAGEEGRIRCEWFNGNPYPEAELDMEEYSFYVTEIIDDWKDQWFEGEVAVSAHEKSIIPTREHDGKTLTCSAIQYNDQGEVMFEVSVTVELNVDFPPEEQEEVPSVDGYSGETAVMMAYFTANPAPTEVVWILGEKAIFYQDWTGQQNDVEEDADDEVDLDNDQVDDDGDDDEEEPRNSIFIHPGHEDSKYKFDGLYDGYEKNEFTAALEIHNLEETDMDKSYELRLTTLNGTTVSHFFELFVEKKNGGGGHGGNLVEVIINTLKNIWVSILECFN